ncbi:metabolite/H+ symporter [Rickettsia typhi]|uniref:Proline/betaine transporter ProP6 n=2 Tax=Rickettsia typhi TaxID=785 RepID=Q68VR1_RICTY|nr:metabolite/H+ symporter [Rickettsia typhi]AAU04295.1 proline/betaine transporter ProP6 [Rickettsia typhi str. Wilmington]AFE54672.1 proline/betaine transporter ProP6 [Rickettsia typhi str. TH1527]AFE55511.1 proline/betaine transporter ProP6 [Rickettsia typhi str. B9991CWPP]
MRKIIISGMIGNAAEWFDFALYAQFAYIIGQHFFPNSEMRDTLTFAVFAAGFIVRPLGGIIFGNIGDRLGRRAALVISIITMTVPTVGIGLLPSYNTIGIAAPIILIIIRLIQGFSLGGEFSGCISYIVEHASIEKRGLAGSASFVSMCAGMLLGLLTASGFSYFMSADILFEWGWRVPFILGLFIGSIGLYIRKNLAESPIYKKAKDKGRLARFPLRETLTQYPKELMIALGLYITVTAPFYTSTVFIGNFMQILGYSNQQSSIVNSIILIVMMIVFPISAYVSDKVGRRPVLICAIILLILLVYPIFVALGSMNITLAIISQVIFAGIIATYMGPIPTVLVEIFPTRVRFTGVALSYNLAAAIFGGTAPMVAMILTRITGDNYAISYYLIALALLSSIILKFYKETYKKNLVN